MQDASNAGTQQKQEEELLWYREPVEKAIEFFKTDFERGLSEEEAKERTEKYGRNILPHAREVAWFVILLKQFRSPLVYVLFAGAVFTALLHEWLDFSVIMLAAFINAGVGFWQTFRAHNTLEKLKAAVQFKTFAAREGGVRELAVEELVPGDIIILKAGYKVPADARLIYARQLEIDEAVLTGESEPIAKDSFVIEKDAVIGDRKNMVFMGTFVSRGDGRAVVSGTGADTELGKIAILVERSHEQPTPLQGRMSKLGRLLACFVGAMAAIIFALGLLQYHPLRVMLTTSIAVAVAAIPEGLPAAISIVLAVSSQRILSRRGVTRRLLAAETLGSTSVICVDKTGTLTEGTMRVEKLITGECEDRAREILALANEAIVETTENGFTVLGELTDRAKMREFLDHGGDLSALRRRYQQVTALGFDSYNKYTASFDERPDGALMLSVTGAPEILLLLSRYRLIGDKNSGISEGDYNKMFAEFESYAARGLRVIALAERKLADKISSGELLKLNLNDKAVRADMVSELTFVGFAVIGDPLREDVRQSMKIARQAGIRVIMLTGDHALTARSVGKELGFASDDECVGEGVKLSKLSDEELTPYVLKCEIFSRIDPTFKLRVVKILQKNGETVAMTGDGVNDAPALSAADIGVALNSGTDIAKEASDLVLLDDSFTTITEAVRQGRIAFDNIRKTTVFLLSGSFSELLLILMSLASPIFLKEALPLPLLAVQILWTNLVEDSLPNVALAFEGGEEDVMRRRPVKRNEPFLDAAGKTIILIIGIFTNLLLMALFAWLYFQIKLDLPHLRTIIFAALGMDTFFYVFSIKSLRQPIFAYSIFSNRYLITAVCVGIVLMSGSIYLSPMQKLLHTVPLSVFDWLIVIAIGVINLICVETAKRWFFRKRETT